MTEAPTHSVTVVRTIRAPVKTVFDAWVDPDLISRMGATSVEVDARVGGRYRIETPDENGQLCVVSGQYTEIVRNERIARSWFYEGPNMERPVETRVTLEFREIDADVTEVTAIESDADVPIDRRPNPDVWVEAEEAWQSALEHLENVVTEKS